MLEFVQWTREIGRLIIHPYLISTRCWSYPHGQKEFCWSHNWFHLPPQLSRVKCSGLTHISLLSTLPLHSRSDPLQPQASDFAREAKTARWLPPSRSTERWRPSRPKKGARLGWNRGQSQTCSCWRERRWRCRAGKWLLGWLYQDEN